MLVSRNLYSTMAVWLDLHFINEVKMCIKRKVFNNIKHLQHTEVSRLSQLTHATQQQSLLRSAVSDVLVCFPSPAVELIRIKHLKLTFFG